MRVQRTAITKAPASDLRVALIHGARSAMRSQGSELLIQWEVALVQRRNRFPARFSWLRADFW